MNQTNTTTAFHTISLGTVNVFVTTGPHSVLIDTGSSGNEEKILRACVELGISEKDISLILLTHAHSDHFGSAASLRKRLGVPVAVHPDDARWVRKGKNPPLRITERISAEARELINERAAAPYPPCAVDLELTDAGPIQSYVPTMKVIPTPGHTPGSLSLVFDNTVAIIGDLVAGRVPQALFPRRPFFAESPAQVRDDLEKLLSLGVQSFYASHGGPFSRRRIENLLKRNREWFARTDSD
jgi:glyoxylase-like metal-dependent hydrolase (beta-lactamase superfamily II)